MLSLAKRTESLTPSYTIGISMKVAELREQGLSLRDAVKQAAKETGLPKNELYDRAVGKHVEA